MQDGNSLLCKNPCPQKTAVTEPRQREKHQKVFTPAPSDLVPGFFPGDPANECERTREGTEGGNDGVGIRVLARVRKVAELCECIHEGFEDAAVFLKALLGESRGWCRGLAAKAVGKELLP